MCFCTYIPPPADLAYKNKPSFKIFKAEILISNPKFIKESLKVFEFSIGKSIQVGAILGPENKYQYNGKEKQEELKMLDYGARFYYPVVGRWNVVDKNSELYFSHSPYAYALNTPMNAIDPDGNIVIFINGNHFGEGATGYEKWRQKLGKNYNFQGSNTYWNKEDISFDYAIMSKLNDNKSLYRGGALGGFFGLNSHGLIATNLASYRKDMGEKQGREDAATIIANLALYKQGNIIESIKIITHSMGGAYGKGYVEALKKYISSLLKELQAQIKITLVVDFDPFQAGGIEADPNIFTQQFSHIGKKGRKSSDYTGWLANEVQVGVDQFSESKINSSHSIFTFFNDKDKVQEGTDIWDGSKFVTLTCLIYNNL